MGLGSFLLERIKGVWSRERRAHHRIYDQPLILEFYGKKHKTHDWSAGGFRLAGPFAHARVRDRVSGEIRTGGSGTTGAFTAEVVRIADNGEVAMRLLEVSPGTFLSMYTRKRF
ncbi:MAG: PilZ domain-containing protein [Kiloniellales bacterium]